MRVVVLSYDAADAAALASRLRRDGFEADEYPGTGTKGFRALRENPPGAILIDLMRQPSYGRAIGALLRENKGTRSIPLVFLEGDPERTARAKELLPDAIFAPLSKIGAALRRAASKPVSNPVVPDLTAVPLTKKLRIEEGATIGAVGAPEDFAIEGVTIARGRRDADVVLVFVKSIAVLARELRGFTDLPRGRALWILWPKQTSRAAGEVSMTRINELCRPLGLVGWKACAVDRTWSAVAVSKRKS